MEEIRSLVIGATGLVGGEIVKIIKEKRRHSICGAPAWS